MDYPFKIKLMTSYGGIIRIRLRVEVGLLPLSLLLQAPLYLLFKNLLNILYNILFDFASAFLKLSVEFDKKINLCYTYSAT